MDGREGPKAAARLAARDGRSVARAYFIAGAAAADGG